MGFPVYSKGRPVYLWVSWDKYFFPGCCGSKCGFPGLVRVALGRESWQGGEFCSCCGLAKLVLQAAVLLSMSSKFNSLFFQRFCIIVAIAGPNYILLGGMLFQDERQGPGAAFVTAG